MLELLKSLSRPPTQVTRIAAPSGAVPRSTTALMDQRGWRKAWTGAWIGHYATQRGTWPGRIEKAGDAFRVFMQNPPLEMQRHPKWPCFHRHDDSGWYRIHLHTNPVDGDPNAVIRYVEQILTESFKL
jgi:hypothetical protein